MTIHLPAELETSIEAAVDSGRFASVDDAMSEAARLLLRTIKQERPRRSPTPPPCPRCSARCVTPPTSWTRSWPKR